MNSLKSIKLSLLHIIFWIIGGGLIVAGFFTDTDALTDDGYPLREFFFLMGGFFFIIPFTLMFVEAYIAAKNAQKDEYFALNGVEHNATLTKIEATGLTVNQQSMLKLTLEIQSPLGNYSVQKKKLFYPWEAGNLKIGESLKILVDKRDKMNIHLQI